MSNYYDYREVKVMIAHRLMAMDGWKVYDYKPDESDSMTDYYNPAHWGGVAEKNGYVLCVNVYGARERQEIREYNGNNVVNDSSIAEKIKKLEAVTMERGATESEETSAKEKIAILKEKSETGAAERNKYVVTGYIPGHMQHPPKCNWHIEKDGIIIEKGNGILKYSGIYYKENYQEQTEDEIREYIRKNNVGRSWLQDVEELEKSVKYRMEEQSEILKLKVGFDKFINKIDSACGGLLGEGDGTIYEKVVVTEYKEENKVVECDGKIEDGQCFILKSNFNYGCYKGLVYRIHERKTENGSYFYSCKLNKKLTKECTGNASSNNTFSVGTRFEKWIEQGAIAFCKIEKVKIPYEVEKVIKKTIKPEKPEEKKTAGKTVNKPKDNQVENIETSQNHLEYEIEESKHTKTNEPLWLVKIKSNLSKEEFAEIKRKFATMKGYYSKFTHSFIFKYDPTEKLNIA